MLGGSCSPCCESCNKCSTLAKTSGGLAKLQSVEVTLSSSDYIESYLYEYTLNFGLAPSQNATRDRWRSQYAQYGITPGYKFSTASYFPGAALSGSYSLSNVSHSVFSSKYRYLFPASGGVCSGSYLECIIYQAGSSNTPGKSTLGYRIDVSFQLVVQLFKWCNQQNSILTSGDAWCQQASAGFVDFGSHVAFETTLADPSGGVALGCDTCIGNYGSGTRTINQQSTGLSLYVLRPPILEWYGQDGQILEEQKSGTFSTTLSNVVFVPMP